MKKLDALLLGLLIAIYLIVLSIFKPFVWTYRFDPALIDKYMRSQDITHDVPGRLFLSDSDIHIATGYLYVQGKDPTEFNFQHPPLLKYFYGWSTHAFGNPYLVQVLFGIALLVISYMFGKKACQNPRIPFVGLVILCFDVLFLDLSSQALLDLGQTVFLMIYLYIAIYHPKRFVLQGICLGLAAASKFWSPLLFFILFAHGYHFIRFRKLYWKSFVGSMVVAFIIFSLVYLQAFLIRGGKFNIVFFELKTLKYWFHHSVASYPGASLVLFMTGLTKSWWADKDVVRTPLWSIFWPISIIVTVVTYFCKKPKKDTAILFLFPILYVLFLSIQAPFARYFIVVLPFLYICLVFTVVQLRHYKKLLFR